MDIHETGKVIQNQVIPFVRGGAAIAGVLAIHAGLRFFAADHAGGSEKAIYTYKVKTEYKSALNIHIHSYQQIPNA
jgi:hypothetical protein